MLTKVIKVWQGIYNTFPDLAEAEDSVQYEWVQELSDFITHELIQSFYEESDVRNYLETCELTKDQIDYFIQNWTRS